MCMGEVKGNFWAGVDFFEGICGFDGGGCGVRWLDKEKAHRSRYSGGRIITQKGNHEYN